jgi:glucose-6-phosphate 1-dehydrogenase
MRTEVDRHIFVIFGGTGDLARRKLIPAFYRLITENDIANQCVLLGVGRRDITDGEYRVWVRDALTAGGLENGDRDSWFDDQIFYQQIGADADSYERLSDRIATIETDQGLPGNRVFYLALPPTVFPSVISGLGQARLGDGPGWTRLVIEKPFGNDLESARSLNTLVHVFFEESQVYRIDHYLGKETVQNLLAFRFANPMFESVWNRDRVESIEITVAEELGIGSRAGYYEAAGALRDMVQNHLTQVLALVAMEPPISFDADHVRNEKVKVVQAIAPIRPENIVFGQYEAGSVAGRRVVGYRGEDGVAPDSLTATFVGIKVEVDTWRWHGVPFYLRTGKRLPRRLTEIAVTFQLPPLCIFHGSRDSCVVDPNVLLITLQPDEGFTLRFNVKAPGDAMAHDTQALHFSHDEVYGRLPDAYQALVLDIIEGDQTLFVRSDEVEASWQLYDSLLDPGTEPYRYEAGTWGPAVSNEGLALGGQAWARE